MAATLPQFPCFLSLLSHKLSFFDPKHQPTLKWTTRQHDPPPLHFALRASSVKKPRRKVKCNAELCNELKEFLAAVGLPEGHVPSMKDLSQHGRDDLAYIVRRRGYKLIRELLADSTKTDVATNADNRIAENQDAIDDHKDIVTGQDQRVNDEVEDFSLLNKASILEKSYGSLITHQDLNQNDSGRVPVESSADSFLLEKGSYNLEGHSELVDNMDVSGYVSTRIHIAEKHSSSSKFGRDMPLEVSTNSSSGVLEDLSNNSCSSNIGRDLNSDGRPSMPIEPVVDKSLDGKVLHRSQDEKVDNIAEEVSLSTEVSVMEDLSNCSNLEPTHNSDGHSYAPLESPENFSLEEKVAKFVQNGDLDTLEDNVYGVLIESDAEEIKDSKFGNTEEVQLRIPTSEPSKNVVDGSDAAMALDGRTSTSKQLFPDTAVDPSPRDDSSSAEGLSSLSDEDFDVKTSEADDQHDISHLKFMLVQHQKELELSRLKELIEKEKLALSVLQTKTETEITKAQKLVSEKDAELHAAEESLSELVEVQIQYCGDGEIVEVTGSFNGWHHNIQMDPQPSSSIVDPIGSSSSCQFCLLVKPPQFLQPKGNPDFGQQCCGFIRGHMRLNSLLMAIGRLILKESQLPGVPYVTTFSELTDEWLWQEEKEPNYYLLISWTVRVKRQN